MTGVKGRKLAGAGLIRSAAPAAIVVMVLTFLPLQISSNVLLNFMTFTMIIALAAQGWNLLGGYGGQFSFGHAAFFGAGAYAMALLQVRFGINAWLALPLAILGGAILGVIIGYLSFRAKLRGSYFALVTLAFAEVLRIAANAAGFTGGAAGVLVPLRLDSSNIQFVDRRVFYWLALLAVSLVLVLTLRISRSRFGAQLVAIRENEDAARALGIDIFVTKMKVITLSAAITAAAGCLYTQKFLYLDANLAFGSWLSIEALAAPIIGGLGTALGPVIGAIVLRGLGEVTQTALAHFIGSAIPGMDLILFGILLILFVGFAPRGLLGLLNAIWLRFREVRK